MMTSRRQLLATLPKLSGLAIATLLLTIAMPGLSHAAEDEAWKDIHQNVFDNRDVLPEDGAVLLDAPVRAEDAALVPLKMTIPAAFSKTAKKLTLVIDKNPAPVVAEIEFGDAAGNGDRVISTRVRVDTYSNIRAVVETADGKLHMATKFVKASGGCSAPASKDADEALANLGKMLIKAFPAPPSNGSAMREAQVMIRHPNFSGLQMDQITRTYTPARFVREVEIKAGGALVFRAETGISISEDPHFRFTYAGGDDAVIEARMVDSDGAVFTAHTAPKGS
jgi:sulfur-oxidizing protein SoxY